MTTDITRSMVEIAVDKALKDIQRDPERSVRNIVDLGEEFARGRFQSRLFRAAQTFLKNRRSAYYRLGRHIAMNIDHEAVKRFGVNVGYNSFTLGARMIREREAAEGYNIPWTLVIHYEENHALTIDDIDAAVASGKALGIYTYQVFTPGSQARVIAELARKHDDCAFLLYLHADTASEADVGGIARTKNLITAPCSEDADYEAFIRALSEEKCLYMSYLYYDERNEDIIASGRWIGRMAEKGNLFAMAIARPGLKEDARARVGEAVCAIREAQRYPIFAMDFYSDLYFIDGIISEQPCFLSVKPDGEVCSKERPDGSGIYLTDVPLDEIIRRTMPRRA